VEFRPGTHEVLLWGILKDDWTNHLSPPESYGRYYLWDIQSDRVREVDPGRRLIQWDWGGFIDSDRALAFKRDLHSWTEKETRPIEWIAWNFHQDGVTSESLDLESIRTDIGVAAALAERGSGRGWIGTEILKDKWRYIKAMAVLRQQRKVLLITAPWRGGNDTRSAQWCLHRSTFPEPDESQSTALFPDEATMDRKPWLSSKPLPNGTVNHVGFQMAVSPDGRMVAFSYERWKGSNPATPLPYRTTPRFAIYSIEDGRHLATLDHSKSIKWEWEESNKEAKGRLLFSRDSKYLYTTTNVTRKWDVRTGNPIYGHD